MTGKTKAAMPGRLSLNALLKHRQITRLAAGGQTLHSPVLARSNYHQGFKIRAGVQNLRSPVWGCSNHDEAAASDLHNSIMVAQNLSRRNPYAQINRVRLTYGDRDKGEQYSGSGQNNVKRGLEAPTKNVESCEDNQPSLRGEPLHNSLIVAQNRPFLRGAVHSITGSNPVQLSGSDLAFLRCSDLSLRPQASRTQAEKLAPELSAFSRSTLASISSIRSCGKRIFLVADFALTDLVAISLPQISVGTPYIKKECKNSLDVWPHFKLDWCGRTLFSRCGNSEARQCANTNRASYHNVTEAYIRACIQHTQTRPKYQYRFLALSATESNVIHITATTEREAREQSPAGCVMVFAGRLPVREARYA